MNRLSLIWAIVLIALPCGCRNSDDADQSGDGSKTSQAAVPGEIDKPPPSGVTQKQIDALRAMPYAGDVSTEQDVEGDGVVRYDREKTHPGYSLYSVQKKCMAELIDETGQVIRRWQTKGQIWSNAELLPNGDLLVIGSEARIRNEKGFPDEVRATWRYKWDGTLIWKQNNEAHHDIELTPDGEVLALTLLARPIPAVHAKYPARDDLISWLDDDGKVTKSLSLYDACAKRPDIFEFIRVGETVVGGGKWVALFHANSIEKMRHKHLVGIHPIFAPQNILVSSRHQNRIFVVDTQREETIWAWGLGELMGQHDAEVLKTGTILLFDNGLGRGWSRVIEVDPLTNKIVWEYKTDPPEKFYSRTKGSTQRLPNGNTLVAESDRGRAFEVTRAGEIVWEFYCPHRMPDGKRATIVRMNRYDRDYIEAIMRQQGG